jgi:hypothetical protein
MPARRSAECPSSPSTGSTSPSSGPRRGQDDRALPRAATLRGIRRARAVLRRRRQDAHAGVDHRPHRDRVAGDLPLPRDDPREPALREAGRDGCRDRGRVHRREHPPHHHRIRARLRHRRGRARLPPVGRGEAAHRDRPRAAEGPAGAAPRRGDLSARHGVRAVVQEALDNAASGARRSRSRTGCRP